MKGFLDYKELDSPMHALNPITKLLLSFLICVGCFACSRVYILPAFIVFDLILALSGKILPEALRILKGLLKVSIFIFVLQLIFVREGEKIWLLPITDKGAVTAAGVVLRLIGATLPLAMMFMLTRLSELTNALVVKARLPYKYAFAVTQTIRFIPGFMTDMYDIMEAQRARGVDIDTKNIFKRVSLIVPLSMPLLIDSVKKTESAAAAARLRGVSLRTRDKCYLVPKFKVGDAVMIIIGALVAAAGIIL